MYQDNPFNRPNPFRSLHSYSSTYSSSFDAPSSYSSHNQDRLQKLLRMNPFTLPYKPQPIINNGIQQYKSGLTTVIPQHRFEPQLPSVSFNYFTKIGGGLVNPGDYTASSYTPKSYNFNKNTITPTVVEEEKSFDKDIEEWNRFNKANNKKQNDQNSLNQVRVETLSQNKQKHEIEQERNKKIIKKESKEFSKHSNQSEKEKSNKSNDLYQQIDYVTTINHYDNNKVKNDSPNIDNNKNIINNNNNNPSNLSNNQIIKNNNSNFSKESKPLQKQDQSPVPKFRPQSPPKYEISLNQFPQAKQNTLNKQIISNINQINYQNENQLLDYNTKYSNQSAPVSKVSGVVYRQESKQSNDLNQLVYPFQSLSKIPSHEQMSQQPSQIVVQGHKYYRLSFKDASKI